MGPSSEGSGAPGRRALRRRTKAPQRTGAALSEAESAEREAGPSDKHPTVLVGSFFTQVKGPSSEGSGAPGRRALRRRTKAPQRTGAALSEAESAEREAGPFDKHPIVSRRQSLHAGQGSFNWEVRRAPAGGIKFSPKPGGENPRIWRELGRMAKFSPQAPFLFWTVHGPFSLFLRSENQGPPPRLRGGERRKERSLAQLSPQAEAEWAEFLPTTWGVHCQAVTTAKFSYLW